MQPLSSASIWISSVSSVTPLSVNMHMFDCEVSEEDKKAGRNVYFLEETAGQGSSSNHPSAQMQSTNTEMCNKAE